MNLDTLPIAVVLVAILLIVVVGLIIGRQVTTRQDRMVDMLERLHKLVRETRLTGDPAYLSRSAVGSMLAEWLERVIYGEDDESVLIAGVISPLLGLRTIYLLDPVATNLLSAADDGISADAMFAEVWASTPANRKVVIRKGPGYLGKMLEDTDMVLTACVELGLASIEQAKYVITSRGRVAFTEALEEQQELEERVLSILDDLQAK